MIYIFEDKKEDILSEFFRKAYPKEVSDKFIYTQGNGMLLSTTREFMINTKETAVVFLDFHPANDSIVKIYHALSKEARDNEYRIIVMPIACAEFYILKFLSKNKMITDETKANIVFNFELYDEVLQSDEVTDLDIKFCRTFERYCKLVTMKWVKECAKTNGTQEYYKENCVCNGLSNNQCYPYMLKQKAIDYISQFPCVPEGSYTNDIKELTVEELWDIHRKLVNMFNQVVDRLKSIDSNRKYKKIKIIKEEFVKQAQMNYDKALKSGKI